MSGPKFLKSLKSGFTYKEILQTLMVLDRMLKTHYLKNLKRMRKKNWNSLEDAKSAKHQQTGKKGVRSEKQPRGKG